MPSRRDDFSLNTKRKLADRVNNLCSNPGCRQPTSGPTVKPDGVTNVGMAAHITAELPGGPRYDCSLSSAQRSDVSNGIWCCYTHGKMIDDDVERYSVQLLRKWKADAEFEATDAIENPNSYRGDTLRTHKLSADQKSLREIIELLPSGGVTIQQLKKYDFGGMFNSVWFDDLQSFVYRDGPEHEFLDNELEDFRLKMMKSSLEFLRNIALKTRHVSADGWRRVYGSDEVEKREEFKFTQKLLNDSATAVFQDYENLVRTGRRKLGV